MIRIVTKLLSTSILSFLIYGVASAQNVVDTTKTQPSVIPPQVVYEGEVGIDPMSKKELNYTFYKGDEIFLTAKPIKGKDISRFAFQRMGQPAMSEYKSKPNLDLKFTVPATDAYTFVFENTALLGWKTIAIKVSRKSLNDSIQALDVAFKTETVSDTSYVEILQKTVRLGRGLLASNVAVAEMPIPSESDGNVAVIIGSEKEIAEWMDGLSALGGIDPASAILGNLLVKSVKSSGGNEIKWLITDAANLQLRNQDQEYKGYYFSDAVSFETKAIQLQPGQTYYLVLENPSMMAAKDIKIEAKARVVHQQTRAVINK
ncbi:MAG: hypothetical protein L0Y74_10945 [candidate division Zixibacteria bacterium]|nr:hypothetical protein [candidate division Zixibacteria bacterium]